MSFRDGVNDAPILAGALDAPEDALKDLGRGEAWVAYRTDGVRKSAIPIRIPKAKLRIGFLHSNIKITQHRYAVQGKDAMHRRILDEWLAHKRRTERREKDIAAQLAIEEEKGWTEAERELRRKEIAKQVAAGVKPRRTFKTEGASDWSADPY